MKLNLNKPLLDLAGNPIVDEKNNIIYLSQLIANRLVSTKDGGLEPLKAYDFALKLYNEGEIEIDSTDLEKLEQEIAKFDITNLVIAQIKKEINKAKIEQK
jgi:hypothetical protein